MRTRRAYVGSPLMATTAGRNPPHSAANKKSRSRGFSVAALLLRTLVNLAGHFAVERREHRKQILRRAGGTINNVAAIDTRPANRRAATDAHPANRRAATDAHPANRRAATDAHPANRRATIDAHPANRRAAIDARPANRRAPIDARPACLCRVAINGDHSGS